MDVNSYGLIAGLVITGLSSIFTFFNKQKLEAQLALYKDGNDELRRQVADVRSERDEAERRLTAAIAKYEEQEKLVKELKELNHRQPDFAKLSRQLATNHKEQMTRFAELAIKIVDKQ